jgi:hypothetical protein
MTALADQLNATRPPAWDAALKRKAVARVQPYLATMSSREKPGTGDGVHPFVARQPFNRLHQPPLGRHQQCSLLNIDGFGLNSETGRALARTCGGGVR